MNHEDEQQKLSLGQLMDRIHGLASSYIFPYLSRNIQHGNYSFSQHNTLYFLHHCGPQTISAIAGHSSITHNAASRMVDDLVKSKIVKRVTDKTDRRKKWVYLTHEGEKQLRTMRDLTIGVYEKILSGLSDDVKADFEKILAKVVEQLPPHQLDVHIKKTTKG